MQFITIIKITIITSKARSKDQDILLIVHRPIDCLIKSLVYRLVSWCFRRRDVLPTLDISPTRCFADRIFRRWRDSLPTWHFAASVVPIYLQYRDKLKSFDFKSRFLITYCDFLMFIENLFNINDFDWKSFFHRFLFYIPTQLNQWLPLIQGYRKSC